MGGPGNLRGLSVEFEINTSNPEINICKKFTSYPMVIERNAKYYTIAINDDMNREECISLIEDMIRYCQKNSLFND